MKIKALKNISLLQSRITIATVFTLLRIFLAPFLAVAIVQKYWLSSCILFAIAAITDWLDGFLARYFNQKTLLGAFLDPVADKVLLFSCFVALWYTSPLFFPLWLVVFVLSKEMIQVLGALWLYCFYQWTEIEPTFIGKCATALQLLVIGCMLFCYYFNYVLPINPCIIASIICLCSALSLVSYVLVAVKIIKKRKKHSV